MKTYTSTRIKTILAAGFAAAVLALSLIHISAPTRPA